jgi:hypothetical protein
VAVRAAPHFGAVVVATIAPGSVLNILDETSAYDHQDGATDYFLHVVGPDWDGWIRAMHLMLATSTPEFEELDFDRILNAEQQQFCIQQPVRCGSP